MKKLLILLFSLAVCLSLFFLFTNESKKSDGIRPNEMKNLLESYETENTDSVAYIKYGDVLLYNEKQIDLGEYLSSDIVSIEEILCVFENRVYMISEDITLEQNHINIASINLDGTDYKTHYVLNLSNDCEFYNKKILNPINQENNSFAEYRDEKIFICVNKKYYFYDIKKDSFNELNESWDFYYKQFPNDNFKSLIIIDNKMKIQKELTLDQMAEMNHLAKELQIISNRKIWNDETVDNRFFIENINMVDRKIYLVCKPMDFWGGGYAVIFKYDIEKSEIFYDSWEYLDDIATSYYVVAID